MRMNVDAGYAAKEHLNFEYFLRIDLDGEIVRYITRAWDFSGEIDGTGTQLWSYYDFRVGQIAQSIQDIMQVSWVDIANLDKAWSDRFAASRFLGDKGLRDRPIYLWECQFYPIEEQEALGLDDTNNLISINQIFAGRIEGAAFDGNRVKLSLVPRSPTFIVSAAASTISPKCGYDYKDPETCQATSSNTTCDKTRANCAVNGNLGHFGGFDLMPRPNSSDVWGGLTVQVPAPISGNPVVVNPWVRPPSWRGGGIQLVLSDRRRPDPIVVPFRGDSGSLGSGPAPRPGPRPIGTRS